VNTDLTRIQPFDDHGSLRVIVESPRGSRMKIDYDPSLRIFSISRELPLGVAYPFDWGFIPGTLGDDGDPLDAMVVHHQSTYPGMLLPCRILGMVNVRQRDRGSRNGKREINNRVIATPAWNQTLGTLEDVRDLPGIARKQMEQFFVSATAFTGKKIDLEGWGSLRATEKFIRDHMIDRD
jgi:inorganic pyrophosphatase